MTTGILKSAETIAENENNLLTAFQNCDLTTLDELLHNDVLFVIPNGELLTKPTVMDNYRSGNSAFSEIKVSDQKINLAGDTAIVAMIMEMNGKYHEQIIKRKFRYIRTWKLFDNNWKVIAVSGVQL